MSRSIRSVPGMRRRSGRMHPRGAYATGTLKSASTSRSVRNARVCTALQILTLVGKAEIGS